IPVVGKVREQARAAVCASNLRQVGTGVHAYAGDNHDDLPPISRSGSSFTTYWIFRSGGYENLGLLLEGGYIDDDQVLFCPSRDVDPAEALSYNGNGNVTTHGTEQVRERSSFPARFFPDNPHRWKLTDTIDRPTLGSVELINVVIYSDFVGVKNFIGGGLSTRIAPTH